MRHTLYKQMILFGWFAIGLAIAHVLAVAFWL